MKLLLNIVDKLVFGTLLLLALQVPLLADHYLQYISGYFAALEKQVEGFEANAKLNAYDDVYAMIDDLLLNNTAAVRVDAQQKLSTLEEYEDLTVALNLFASGNILQQSWYMFQPSRYDTLQNVLDNFEPGIPLGVTEILYAIVLAMLLNLCLLLPGKCLGWIRQDKHKTGEDRGGPGRKEGRKRGESLKDL
mgnify:CR=1 FL=1|tara:strand:- start:410 stop:985 length:576 start_codon:yes stop_codon:yes gene_type:complete